MPRGARFVGGWRATKGGGDRVRSRATISRAAARIVMAKMVVVLTLRDRAPQRLWWAGRRPPERRQCSCASVPGDTLGAGDAVCRMISVTGRWAAWRVTGESIADRPRGFAWARCTRCTRSSLWQPTLGHGVRVVALHQACEHQAVSGVCPQWKASQRGPVESLRPCERILLWLFSLARGFHSLLEHVPVGYRLGSRRVAQLHFPFPFPPSVPVRRRCSPSIRAVVRSPSGSTFGADTLQAGGLVRARCVMADEELPRSGLFVRVRAIVREHRAAHVRVVCDPPDGSVVAFDFVLGRLVVCIR